MFHSEVQKVEMKSKVEHMHKLNVACLVDAQGKLSMRHQKQGSAGFVVLFLLFFATWGVGHGVLPCSVRIIGHRR